MNFVSPSMLDGGAPGMPAGRHPPGRNASKPLAIAVITQAVEVVIGRPNHSKAMICRAPNIVRHLARHGLKLVLQRLVCGALT
jgi:hypothetical protein